MWAIFTDLRNLKTSHRLYRIFRVVSYGTILILLCFADLVVEAARKSPGGYSYLAQRIVITTSLAGVLAFLCLRLLQPRGAFLIQSLSPHSRRSVRTVSILSSIYFLLFVGVAYCGDLLGKGPMLRSIIPSLPLCVPLLMIVSFLSGGQLKRGLALAVAMYSTLFLVMSFLFLVIGMLSNLPDQLISSLAVLASLFTTSMAVWSYYTLPRETHDLRKLHGAFGYFFLLFVFVMFLPLQSDRDRQTIHAQMAKEKLIEINRATSAYATHFGGFFPESLDALGPPAKNQKADCRSAGFLDKPFTTNSGAYIFEYRIGLPSRTAPGGCEGATQYTIRARPVPAARTVTAYSIFSDLLELRQQRVDETFPVNFYTDESGIIRCTFEDRLANAHDHSCYYLPTFR